MVVAGAANLPGELDSVGEGRARIHEDHVELPRAGELLGFRSARQGDCLQALGFENFLEEFAHGWLAIDQQGGFHGHAPKAAAARASLAMSSVPELDSNNDRPRCGDMAS